MSANFFWPQEHLDLRRFFLRDPLQALLICRGDKRPEQRVRLQRLRLELRVKLAPDEVRMVRQFNHFDVGSVGSRTGNAQSRRGQGLFILAIEFVTVAVTLADFGLAVDAVSQGPRLDFA